MSLYLPEQLSKLRIIIEYNDCIVQARDLLNYIELQDDRAPTFNHSFMRNGERNSHPMNKGF
jgi:hypothetical protein